METRKVQQLGPATLAMTLPAEWARDHGVTKGDEVTLREGGDGTLTVLASSGGGGSGVIVRADRLDADGLERAIIAQYALGRHVIHVRTGEGHLPSDHIQAVYDAESQLMGLGVIEETPEDITIRCSVEAADFELENLLERLESTGRTMRDEAMKALAHGNADLATRVINRERQANKIFVLLLRLTFTAYRNPELVPEIGLESSFPLIGYRSVAKNLELTADNAQDIAAIVVEREGQPLDVDDSTMYRIREFADTIDALTADAVRALIDRDYELSVDCRQRFHAVRDAEGDLLRELPELSNETLLQVREVLVGLRQTAEYAMRNAQIAANLALDRESEHVELV
ncbi:MAG: PhoU domain-containing protein, partial [Haloferacaceae archaeon]